MFPPTAKTYTMTVLCGIFVHAGLAAPEDEQVSQYLVEHQLDALLEVQLFDRFMSERDSDERLKIAEQLAAVYMDVMTDEGLTDEARQAVLVKGGVLVGLVPQDKLLDLRIELLVQRYNEYERTADLDRLGLLSDESRGEAIDSLAALLPELKRIAVVSGVKIEQLDRTAARTSGEAQKQHDLELRMMRSVNSRAHFIMGWAGYSDASLREAKASNEVLSSFGWVLGFEGKAPVLDQVDLDLLEYDHVARAMLGVALTKLHNGESSEARSWLNKIIETSVSPEFAVRFAHQRVLETMLRELDWTTSVRQVRFLKEYDPESLFEIAQARLLVLQTMGTHAGGAYGQRGNGGQEGATELAKMGLERLIELGEIGHVLDLQRRFGTLPLMNSGFVGLYTQGLSELAEADDENGNGSYAQAALKLGLALESSDVERYRVHAADAALKLAYCQMRLGKPGESAKVLESSSTLFIDPATIEEAAWLMILAHDAAVQGGQDQLAERLSELIAEYIRNYPSSERANTLVVRYAMTPHLQAADAMGALVIDDPSDPMALIARRKYIQVLYKNPELVVDANDPNSNEVLFSEVLQHAQWIWEYESRDPQNVREGRERLAVVRIVLATGVGLSDPDLSLLSRVLQVGEDLIASMPALDGSASELGFREVQVLLLQGRIEQAGEIVLSGTVLEESVASVALGMVYESAFDRFKEKPTVSVAQAVIRYGRAKLDQWRDGARIELDRKHSQIAEAVAESALYMGGALDDSTMREYGVALGIEVLEQGVPSNEGLLRTAEGAALVGSFDVSLECWLMLVSRLSANDDGWHRARYESFRLLRQSDPIAADTAYAQYVVLYPDGSPEPWGGLIRGIFGESDLGAGEVGP